MPTPRGLAKLNIAHDSTKASTFDNILSNNSLTIFCQSILSLIFKILTERLLWAMLSPRLNAMMALCIITYSSSGCSFLSQIVNLCIITAKKSVSMSPLLGWRPIASPWKNRIEQKYRLDKCKFFDKRSTRVRREHDFFTAVVFVLSVTNLKHGVEGQSDTK